ncbi:metal ABC transporter substrate-binding protein [Dissulfurimicrobium hydrothermale]|uniref:metal ABC transporter substrate-binding protein n=1 Tax=Dissulfurimicrobium hydrothermale TaxID=1750598 RepID=UPI001EDB9F95|nr:metal ABC transporter substrate-binding protein [Dissulfurimicrobium hydrothermale]UKL13604.1 metal ABC transporter substrate-binding protein [Dissulfurimicrobium hydrothermale]
MNRAVMRFFAIVCIVFVFFGLYSAEGATAEGRLAVVTSIFPVSEMVRAVGGDRVDVRQLLPPGSDPHSWEPKISDMLCLEQADLVVLIGAGLEPWAGGIVNKVRSGGGGVLVLAEGSDLKGWRGRTSEVEGHDHHGHGWADPHIWLDFKWDAEATMRIAKKLADLDPAGAGFYEENARRYAKALEALDTSYRRTLSSCEQKTLVVAGHAAFGYLAEAYGLRQVALYGISPDASPSPKKMADVIELVKKEGVKAIFFDDTVNDSLGKAISRETGAQCFVITPGESLKKNDIVDKTTFIKLMYRNLAALSRGLGCKGSAKIPPEKQS